VQYITTTELRTKSRQLVEELLSGGRVKLIHRSKVVGKIEPAHEPKQFTKETIVELKKIAKRLNLPKLSYKERERRYGNYLKKRYG